MSDNFPVHWLEEIIEKILARKEPIITLATGKTPSGYIHLGILREIIICDSIRRILEKKGKMVKFYLFIDSLDAAKRFPDYIEEDFQKNHIGKPFSYIPCPFKESKCDSYAHHFGNDLTSTLVDFGIKTEIIWSHELYKTKEMQEKIKIALENTKKIKKIIKKYILPTLDDEKKDTFIEMQKNWIPVMVICERCNKIQYLEEDGSIKPNRVINYFKDEIKVSYVCSACNHYGKLSIYSGRLKLNWRVDWPAKWAIYKTTCEPAGKDHSVKGGAYDTGIELCQEVYNFIGPVKVAYEWLRLGDRDMKTSKGIVFTPKKYLELATPEVFRTIILRTNPTKHIAFRIEEIPQYYDYYDRMEDIYFSELKGEKEENKNLRYIFPLTQIRKISNKRTTRIPFNLIIFLSQIQNILSIEQLYEKAKDATQIENFENGISLVQFRKLISQTTNWITTIKGTIENEHDEKVKREMLRKINIFTIPEKFDSEILSRLNENQKKGIDLLRKYLIENDPLDPDLIQNKIFTIAKNDLNIPPRKLFETIYKIILGKKFGPRIGSFLSLLDKNWLLERLNIEML